MRALYTGYTTGTENHGDEALIWIIRDMLAPEIEVVTGTDEYDVALLGGGTLINQSPWLIDHFKNVLDKSRTGRGIVFGTGVGDLSFWGDHFNRWTPLLERCDAVGVRGPYSQSLLEEHGFHRACVCGDPYLWLRPPVQRIPIPKRLGVNFGSTNDALWGTNDLDFREFIAETLGLLKKRGWRFSFLSVWSRDLPLMQSIAERFGGPADCPVLDARQHPLECYSMLAGCELFLGEKLHANAMSAVAGTPFLALEYQPKVRDFSASVGMEQWTVSTAERDPRALADRIEQMQSEREEISLRMKSELDMRRLDLADFAALVKSILSSTERHSAAAL